MKLKAIQARLANGLLAVPVFVKVMGIALGLSVLLGAGMLWQIHENWHRVALRDLERRGKLVGDGIAAHGLAFVLSEDVFELQRLLDETQSRSDDIAYVLVVNARGQLLADTLPGEPSLQLIAANRWVAGTQPTVALLDTEGGPVRDVAVPILQGAAGTVRVGMSEHRVAFEVGWLTRRLARVTAVIALLGMLAAWWLTRIFSRPINELVHITHAVEQGDFNARAPVRAADEVGDLARAFNEMTGALAQKEAIRQKLLRQVIEAGEDERKRVSRELHDQIGQTLTSLIAGLTALETCAPQPACGDKLVQLRALAVQALGDLHDVSVALRPSALDDLGLVAALQKHGETFAKRFGIAVECEAIGLNGGRRLPVEIETALYRIVQEALTNAVRHGQARSIAVLLQRKDGHVLAVIEDDGEGFDATDWRARCLAGNHLGLLGIEERAALVGGTLRVESAPGSGTSLFVEIPLRKEAHG